MTRSMLIAAIAALLAMSAAAYAGTSHVFGVGGKHYTFDAMCHRVSFVRPGVAVDEQVNVLGQQVRCLVRRPDPFARCVKRLGAAPAVEGRFDHGAGNPGDWKGITQLQAYIAAIGACSKAGY